MRERRVTWLSAIIGLAIVVATSLALGVGGAPRGEAAGSAQVTIEPQAFLTAQTLADGVRYAVSLTRDPGQALRDVRVEVRLPAGAQLVEAYESPGYTRFQAGDGGLLRWSAAAFAPGPYVDAFAFLLREAPAGEFDVVVTWDGDRPGQYQTRGNPRPLVATALSGEIVVGPEGTAELVPSEDDPNVMVPLATPGGVAVGDTGVLIALPPNAVPAGTVVRVRKLAPADDPPAAAGDLWWCAVVEVTGLPAGVEAYLYVTPRRPLPPDAPVAMFVQRDGRWERSAQNGRTLFSGQAIWMPTRGGVLAAGVPTGLRNQAAGAAVTPVATPLAGVQPPRVLAAAPTAVVGALPTPTPIGNVVPFRVTTETSSTPGGTDPGSGSGAVGGGSGGGEPLPLTLRRKLERMLDLGSCAGGTSSGSAGFTCSNGGGGTTSCDGTGSCTGRYFQGGLFRRDGVQSCSWVGGVDGARGASCSFTQTS